MFILLFSSLFIPFLFDFTLSLIKLVQEHVMKRPYGELIYIVEHV